MQLMDAGIGNAGKAQSSALAIGQAVPDRTRPGRDAASAPSDRGGTKTKDQVCCVVAWGKGKKDGG